MDSRLVDAIDERRTKQSDASSHTECSVAKTIRSRPPRRIGTPSNPQQTVVLGQPLRARHGAHLDLTRSARHRMPTRCAAGKSTCNALMAWGEPS